MSGVTLRLSTAQDDTRPMRALWKTAFSDPDAVVSAFFDSLYAPGRAMLALRDGELLGCAYLLPGVRLCSADGEARAASYFYALAVQPEARGRGIGAVLTAESAALAAAREETLCLMPGDGGLRRWYGERCGFSGLSTVRTVCATASDGAGSLRTRRLSPDAYRAAREALLSGTPHAALPEDFFAFQERLCALCGGGLLELSGGAGQRGLACAEREDARLSVNELLWDGDEASAASALAAAFGAETCLAACPGGDAPAVMARAPEVPDGLWWGPVFA